MEYIEIYRDDLMDLYAKMREMSEGRGLHKLAVDYAIGELFEILGEPGAGDE